MKKTALVTGSYQGIGKGIADMLSAHGYTVVYSDVREAMEGAENYCRCDISSEEDRRKTEEYIDRDEFEMPVGYDEAAVGGEFLKIGAGRERRRSKAPYTNRDGHEIVRRAEISVSREKGALIFFAADSLGDYAYRYRKRISAEGGKLIVSHFLENAGKRSWETLWYSHAFLPHGGAEDVYACLPSGYVPLRNAEDVIPEGDGRRTKWKIPAFAAAREKGVCPNWRAEGENFQALEIGGRRIYEAKGNYPFGELQIFVNRRIASAEPKLHIRLGEGQTREWTTEYLFGKSGRENNVE